MVNVITTAAELGYLRVPDQTLIEIDQVKNYPDEQLVLITTGSQGESMAALSRLSLIHIYKQEIVERSWEIGTYDTSVLPYEDCCTIFVAKHPVTKPNLNVIRKSEEKLAEKIDELMEAALSTAEVIEIQ